MNDLPMKPRAERAYEIVVFGATSFVGKLLVDYLYKKHGVGGDLTWAIAARSQSKLNDLKAGLGQGAEGLPTILADTNNPDSLKEMCNQTRVLITTVGPYDLYGESVVRACVETGTDYCDLTGETQFMHRMIEKYVGEAEKSGARIVHTCGFDSIPSDMGTLFLQDYMLKTYNKPASRVRMRVRKIKGGASGGTFASMMNIMKQASEDPALRKVIGNPYALCPPVDYKRPKQPDITTPEIDPAFKSWLSPFIMAAVNTRVVHRSNALLGYKYGENFQYDEAVMMGSGFAGLRRTLLMTGGLAGFGLSASFGIGRYVLSNFVLPAPGEGPSPEEQERGNYDIRFHGKTDDGQECYARVTGDRDPGYGSTAKMLGESALFLLNLPTDSVAGGFWTPASAFGTDFIPKLVEEAGLTFEIMS